MSALRLRRSRCAKDAGHVPVQLLHRPAPRAIPCLSTVPYSRENPRPFVACDQVLLGSVLSERLADKSYSADGAAQWSKEISDEIKSRLKAEFDLPRYKFVVQVLIGEQRGEGIRFAGRCLWDHNTDAFAEDSYRNDSLFCVASAYGVYLY
mmetsp:Transcript_37533/g.112132  ORF Transcript_37533/g.112132 Transcript_37533/m.112132 type:complete len:151 (+) Transcript_37533:106-558(+)